MDLSLFTEAQKVLDCPIALADFAGSESAAVAEFAAPSAVYEKIGERFPIPIFTIFTNFTVSRGKQRRQPNPTTTTTS